MRNVFSCFMFKQCGNTVYNLMSHNYIYSSALGVPVVVLMKYCSEGDNIPDAVSLCSRLNTLLKLVSIFIHCFCAGI
jgi:hypothetical protein